MTVSRKQLDETMDKMGLSESDKAYVRNKVYREQVQPTLKKLPRAQREAKFQEWGRVGTAPKVEVEENPIKAFGKAFARETTDHTITGQAGQALSKKAFGEYISPFEDKGEFVAQGPAAGTAEIAGRFAAQMADPLGNVVGGKVAKGVASLSKTAPVLKAGLASGAVQGGGLAALEQYNTGEFNGTDLVLRTGAGALMGGGMAALSKAGAKPLGHDPLAGAPKKGVQSVDMRTPTPRPVGPFQGTPKARNLMLRNNVADEAAARMAAKPAPLLLPKPAPAPSPEKHAALMGFKGKSGQTIAPPPAYIPAATPVPAPLVMKPTPRILPPGGVETMPDFPPVAPVRPEPPRALPETGPQLETMPEFPPLARPQGNAMDVVAPAPLSMNEAMGAAYAAKPKEVTVPKVPTIRDLVAGESGLATAEGAFALPGTAAARGVAGAGKLLAAADRKVDQAGKLIEGKTSEVVAAGVNKIAGRDILQGGTDLTTGEDRLGQQAAMAYDKLREPIRNLIMGPKLGDDYQLLKGKSEAAGRMIAQEGENVAQGIRHDLTPDQVVELYRVLNDRSLTDTDLARVSEPVRARINELSREMHEHGALSDNQFSANENQYLKRLYEKHLEQQPAVSKIAQAAMRWVNGEDVDIPMKTVIAQDGSLQTPSKRIRGSKYRGKKATMSEEAFNALNQTWEQLRVDPSGKVVLRNTQTGATKTVGARQAGDYLGTWKTLEKQKNGKVVAWRDYTQTERDAMGESKDAALAIEATFKNAAREIQNGRLLKDVAGNRDMAVPASQVGDAGAPEGWVHFTNEKNQSGKPKWGALTDHYVRPDVAQDLQMTRKIQNEWKTWRTLMAWWKKGRTVYNPASHLNNIMQNTVTLEMNGGSVSDLPAAARVILDQADEFQAMREAGLFDDTFALTELANAITHAPVDSPTGTIAYMLHALQKADETATKAYGGADNIFRAALVLGKVREGMPMEQAVDLARTRMYHGRINSPALDAASNSVLPFIKPVAWTVAEVPKMAMRNPAKLAKLGMYYLLWNQAATMFSGQTNEQVKAREKLLPEYLKGPGKVAQFPMRDTYGQPLILNTANWNPVGVFDTKENAAIPWLPQSLNPGGPLITASKAFSNYDDFRERKIRDESLPPEQQAWDVAKFLVGELAPTQVFNSAFKIADAVNGVEDYGGRKYDVPTAIANAFGIKLQPFDDKKAYGKLAKKRVRELDDMKDVLKDAAKDVKAGRMSKEQYQSLYERQVGRIRDHALKIRQELTEAKPALLPTPAN